MDNVLGARKFIFCANQVEVLNSIKCFQNEKSISNDYANKKITKIAALDIFDKFEKKIWSIDS